MSRYHVAGFVGALVGLALAVGSPNASAQTCQPLACSEILVDLPYLLDFAGDDGGVLDQNDVGTGFTYVDQPTNGTGYIPDNLLVEDGRLKVTTTAGSFDRERNSLDNALAVGVDAPSQVTRISATLESPPNGSGAFEQGGIWFGNDEDNFLKLVALSHPTGGTKIEYAIEVGGEVLERRQSVTLDWSGKSVRLTLLADPTDREVEALFQLDDGPPVTLGTLIPPGEFFSFDGARVDPAIGTDSFAGILATHLNGPGPLLYEFGDFSVVKERDVGATPADLLGEGIAFSRSSYPIPNPTSMVMGPDGRLYVSEMFGTIHALSLNEQGDVVGDQVITTLGERLTLGLTVDPASTADGVVLWATHSSPSLFEGAPNSGIVSRLSGPGFSERQDVITGLPRAIANHATNSLHFGPDGRLYIAQGGNTGAGAPSGEVSEFGDMEEQPLSAALLVADVRAPGFDGSCATSPGSFGPPPCDVQTFSTGLRNTYDFVFHSNGSIYGADNGVATAGTFPASPTPDCTVDAVGLSDPALWDADPPGDKPGEQPDSLNLLEQGGYYGHPNPYRNECVFNDGRFQGVPAPANYVPPIHNLGLSRSTDGIIEYESGAHCGSLRGDLLATNFSIGDEVRRLVLAPDGRSVLRSDSLARDFDEPLPLTQGPDGTIYVGEFTSGLITALKPVDIGCWREEEALSEEILDAGGAALGGKLYLVAGEDAGGQRSQLRIFDPASGSWSAGPNLPGPAVENPAVAAYAGKLYVFGGSTASFSGAVRNAAAFDPASNSWQTLPQMSQARGGATAQAIDGRLYVAGGLGPDGASLSGVEAFDPAAGTGGDWDQVAPMGTRRDNAGSAVLDGRLYVFGGGTRESDGSGVGLTSVEMYDPASGSWTPRAPMPTARQTMAVGTLNGRAQLIGGETSTSPRSVLAVNEEYDPRTNSWRALTSMRTPRHGAAAGTIGGSIFVAGGGTEGGSSFSSVNEAFSFKQGPPGPSPVSRRCGGRKATVVGTPRANILRGTARADVIAGLGGADRIVGRGARDRICGGPGKDKLFGGRGRDLLRGGAGADRLFGGLGRDSCNGMGGRDRRFGCE